MKTLIDSTSLVNPQYDASTSSLNSNRDAPTPVVKDNHNSPRSNSPWSNVRYGSNIKYGVGMLAFMAIPPLIPGITTRVIIIGFMCLIVSIYTVAGIMAAIRVRHPARRRKMA